MIDCSRLKGRQLEICTGVNLDGSVLDMPPSKRIAYLKVWFPDASPESIVTHVRDAHVKNTWTGLGDVVASAIKYATFGTVTPCGSCNKRKDYLNSLVPFNNVSDIEITESAQRNFLMHIWPTEECSAWRWNCDQVKKRASLFNGRRVIAIAQGGGTESASIVKDYMSDFTDEFIVVNNNPKIREGASFPLLLEKVSDLLDDQFTFYCHAKGARHRGGFGNDGSTLAKWTEVMYEKCLDDWPIVKQALEKKAMTGCFKRYGNFKTPGNHRWHYSGSFYWFRNRDVFSRNWKKIDNMFFAVESWPGHLFTAAETHCLFVDHCEDLYSLEYWNSLNVK